MSLEKYICNPPLLVGIAFLSVLFAGCSGEAECQSDLDCPDAYDCASSGGVFASTSVCLPTSRDAGGESADTDDNDSDPPTCNAPLQWCDGECVDLLTDDDHCGLCGTACADGESCDDGTCECDAMCCDDDDCGSLGDCILTGAHPYCDCHEDAEYNPDFETCVDTGDPDPCDGVDCGFGDCEVVNNMASCDCDSGFIFDPGDMKCVDPCDDVDCGPNGECLVAGDDWSCDCDAGFEFDATAEECVSSDPCDDVSCGANESCTIVGGDAQCECDDGYEMEGSTCVAVPECKGGVSECAVYVLYQGAFGYQDFDYESTDLADALDGPVVAGFGLEDTDRAYLLTESSYLRIDTTDFSVQATGSLSALHPALANADSIQFAYSVPERHPGGDIGDGNGNDAVTFFQNPSSSNHGEALTLAYDFSSAGFDSEAILNWTDDFDWSADTSDYEDFVPPTNVDYLAGWLDDKNHHEWIDSQASPADACNDDNAPTTPDGLPYLGLLTSEEQVYYQTPGVAGHCSPYLDANSEPLTYFSAPDPGDIGAVVWHNRTLYIFTAGYID